MSFGGTLERGVMVPSASDGRRTVGALATGNKKTPVTARQLATKWGIGLGTARKTLEATTQRGVRTVLHPTLS